MTETAPVHQVLEDMTTLDGDRLAQPAPALPLEPNGGVIASLIAAGAGCALLGVLTVITEASETVAELMTISQPVGPLSGKTTVATAAWLVLWLVLHMRLRRRELDLRRGSALALGLIALGLVGTFPPVYQLFAAGG